MIEIWIRRPQNRRFLSRRITDSVDAAVEFA
jgi:hypothetical protein